MQPSITIPAPPRPLKYVSIIPPNTPLDMSPRASTTTTSPGCVWYSACLWSWLSGSTYSSSG